MIDKLKKMNKSLSQNLQTIASDQQTKLGILSQIDTKRKGIDANYLKENIMNVLNVVGDVFTMIELVCATNPTTIAVSGIMLVLNSLLGIFSIISNIKEINKLEKQLNKLEDFYCGGQFAQDCTTICTLSFQLAQNFYFFVVAFRSLVN